jgi:hypothetical protein
MLIINNYSICLIVERIIGFSDILCIAPTIGLVGTIVLTLIFSKNISSLSIDQQTRFSMT